MKNILIPLGLFLVLELFLRASGLDRVGAEKFFRNIYDPLIRTIPGAKNPYTDISEFLNKDGFRGPDVDPRKNKGDIRIVCLGASRTFGMVPYPDAYPTILGELLKKRGRFEVINAGIPGTNLYQQRLLFEEVFADADVDVLLLMPEPNYRPELKRFRDRMKSLRFRTLRAVHSALSRSAVYRVIRRIVTGFKEPMPGEEDEEASRAAGYTQADYQEDYREDLSILADLAEREGFRLIILGEVDQAYIRRIRELGADSDERDTLKKSIKALQAPTPYYFAQQRGIPYVNLAADFIPSTEPSAALWVDPLHPGPYGNRLIAERIVKELEKLGVVERNP